MERHRHGCHRRVRRDARLLDRSDPCQRIHFSRLPVQRNGYQPNSSLETHGQRCSSTCDGDPPGRRNCGAHSDPNGNAKAHGNPFPHCDTQAYSHADACSYSNGYTQAHGNPDACSYSNGYT